MKKIILMIAAVTMLGLFSCNKEVECNCTRTNTIVRDGLNGESKSTYSETTNGKVKVKEKCSDLNTTTVSKDKSSTTKVECK